MSCRQTQDLFLDSLDAPLGTADQAVVDRHLAACPACVGRMRDTIALRQVLGGVGALEARRDGGPLPEGLVQRILAARAAAAAAPSVQRRQA
jgi:anti-sigma factor RsiW